MKQQVTKLAFSSIAPYFCVTPLSARANFQNINILKLVLKRKTRLHWFILVCSLEREDFVFRPSLVGLVGFEERRQKVVSASLAVSDRY